MNNFLTIKDVEDICYAYAETKLRYDEPLPSFDTRYPEKLEAVLASPQTQISGKFVYSSLARQAAVLFYEITKQHPFFNGNERIACVSLMVFLLLNNHWLETSWKELYDIAVTVASSKSENRDGVLQLLTDFIQNNIVEK
jgi:death-on-curing family protein